MPTAAREASRFGMGERVREEGEVWDEVERKLQATHTHRLL